MTGFVNKISAVYPGSIAEELGIEAGDMLIAIDHVPVLDVFDFRMRMTVPELLLEIEKADGERIEYEIEKDEYDDLGVEFSEPLMDKGRSCRNKCIFCFIDQLPPNLRESLYFKDDDLRLSFLTGNYVTLTNLKADELDRLISYRLSPMNISVHTTNPQLRVKMMHNKDAGIIMEQLGKITEAGIQVNCQIVLCPGVNDGEALIQTLEDLSSLGDNILSIAVVPVGLTRFRAQNQLEHLQPFGQSSARRTIDIVTNWQQIFIQSRGERILYAADEFYIKAGVPTPPVGEYDGFPQLENGVGMLSLFQEEMENGIRERLAEKDQPVQESALDLNKISDAKPAENRRKGRQGILLITGTDAKPFLEHFAPALSGLYDRPVAVLGVPNRFFGESVTVAGLVTGGDIVYELSRSGSDKLFKQALFPSSMLRSGESVFLDDMTPDQVCKASGMKLECVEPTGTGLLEAMDRKFSKSRNKSKSRSK